MTINKMTPADRALYARLQEHGIWLSEKAKPLNSSQALALIAQSIFERFVREFSGVSNALFADCQLKDFEATKDDWQRWLGDDYPALSECKEVTDSMEIDIQNKVKYYVELLETIREHTGDEAVALAVFGEIVRDMRSVKSVPKKVFSPDSPATDKQIEYLKKLGSHIPEHLTRQQASDLIDKAQQWQYQAKAALKTPIKIPA